MSKMRIISIETMQKLEGMYRLVRSIASKCNPLKMDTEPSFQQQFYDIAQSQATDCGFLISKEIKTAKLKTNNKCIRKEDVSYWKVDFLLQVDNALIPIELKLRHKGQDSTNYDKDYIEDVNRIREFLSYYDNCPKGYAIVLTDDEDFKNRCDNISAAYTKENKLTDDRTVTINWSSPMRGYYLGIVGRVQTENRLNTPKNTNFEFLSEEQIEDFDWENLEIDLTDSEIGDLVNELLGE